MQNEFNKGDDKVVFRTPPKMAFTMGILVGITVASLTAFLLTFSLLKSDVTNTNNSVATTNTTNTAAANTNTEPTPEEYAASLTKVDVAVADTDHTTGTKDAPITIVQYSDFECPYCSRVLASIDQLMEDYAGQVELIYRHFPLTSLHDNAQKAAEASECAADQGKFWEMHDKMFENQDALAVDNLKTYAKDLGLNTATFNKCLDDGKYTTKVEDSITAGAALGVNGTPATFVNGRLVSGARPYAYFKAVVDLALEQD
ncbi:MAG: DsbA family protein [Patescibacteria group bacterium]|nr:DsbA family protein [Patescibacteria group bacterium]MDD5715733.1 DsbA family protein [Patescibacteria group bacterium]